ncbi:YqgFc domain-containing protein [Citrus sinensis]|nr:YqgFc domain-containing protein [Citrus sinensis]
MKYVKPLRLFEQMLKRKVSKRGRFLGLDVGDKYVGLSISDPKNKIASPLSVLLRKKNTIDLMAEDFRSLISEFNLEGFIVGYPFNRQQNAADAVQVKLFIDDLSATKKLEDMKYAYWNEGFTSKNLTVYFSSQGVELLLNPLDLHPVEHKTILDKFAAVGILQEYLDNANRKVNLKANVLRPIIN